MVKAGNGDKRAVDSRACGQRPQLLIEPTPSTIMQGGATHRCTAYYSGHVQGVGFRYTTLSIARGYNVAGFVQNLPDGRVELVAEGEKHEIDAFLREVRERFLNFHPGEWLRALRVQPRGHCQLADALMEVLEDFHILVREEHEVRRAVAAGRWIGMHVEAINLNV